jgi:hypothetical protein
MQAPPGCRKRALDDDDRRTSPRASSESENISPRLLDAQVGLPAPMGGHAGIAGAGSERGRTTGAVKSRRLSQDLGESPAQFVAKITALSAPASPALRVLAPFLSDAEAARTPSGGIMGSPFELKKAAGGITGRPMFMLGSQQSQGRPALPTPLGTPGRIPEQKTSPPSHLQGIAARTGGPGVSPMGNQEQKASPMMQARAMKPLHMKAMDSPLANQGLPTVRLERLLLLLEVGS